MPDADLAGPLESGIGMPVRGQPDRRRPRHCSVSLADGRELFVKAATDPAADVASAALEAEAHGLRWRAEADAAPVPEIIFSMNGLLALTWIPQGTVDRGGADPRCWCGVPCSGYRSPAGS